MSPDEIDGEYLGRTGRRLRIAAHQTERLIRRREEFDEFVADGAAGSQNRDHYSTRDRISYSNLRMHRPCNANAVVFSRSDGCMMSTCDGRPPDKPLVTRTSSPWARRSNAAD